MEDIDIIRKGKDGEEFGDGPIDCIQLRPHVTDYVFYSITDFLDS